MSTNRITGPTPPESNRSTGAEKIGRYTMDGKRKVEKVEEVDEETKKRKFEQAMEEAEGTEEVSSKEDEEPQERMPSPFESKFHTHTSFSPKKQKKELEDLAESSVPSPSQNSAPPSQVGVKKLSKEKEDPLPQSREFWQEIDEPPQAPLPAHHFETHVRNQKKEEQAFKQEENKTSFRLSGGPASIFPEEQKRVHTEKPLESHPRTLDSSHESSQESFSPASSVMGKGFIKTSREREQEDVEAIQRQEQKRDMEKKVTESHERAKRDEKRKKEDVLDITHLPKLPPVAAPFAMTATQQAIQYLDPNTFALFYQMVGTIFILTSTRGMTKTDVVLNSPAFARSKFYGATITIEKYETAPDALNIRLTGSAQAVAAFNQNLPSLMNSFQEGDFSFRINRIEAEYQTS